MKTLASPSPRTHASGAARAVAPRRRGPPGTAALAKTMELLDLIALSGQPPTFADLARASGLPRGTLHRLLAALVDHGMVALSEADNRYLPGTHLLELARHTWEDMDLRRAAQDAIAGLHARSQETVHLGTLSGDGVVYIDKLECDYPLRLHSAIGRRGPVHCTALGKVMAAWLDPAEQGALIGRLDLQRHTAATLATPAALRRELRQIRADGVAYDREEHVPGMHCVAAPVLDFRGRCVGGISVTAPTARVGVQQLEQFAGWVREAAALASARLGGASAGGERPA